VEAFCSSIKSGKERLAGECGCKKNEKRKKEQKEVLTISKGKKQKAESRVWGVASFREGEGKQGMNKGHKGGVLGNWPGQTREKIGARLSWGDMKECLCLEKGEI